MIVIGLRFGPYLRGEQLQQQADVARTVQLDLMTPVESIPKDLDFAGSCIPAWQVGGDFYDVYANKNGRIGLIDGCRRKGPAGCFVIKLDPRSVAGYIVDIGCAVARRSDSATERFPLGQKRARTLCQHDLLLLRPQDIHSAVCECGASTSHACPQGSERNFLGTAIGRWRPGSRCVTRFFLWARRSCCRSWRLVGDVFRWNH